MPFTTASVNIVNGGIAANIVPDRCTVQLEFRSISGVDAHEVLGRISAHCDELQEQMRQEHPEAGVEVRTLAMVPGLDTGRSSRPWRSAPCSVARRRTEKVAYGTEAGLFQRPGIATVVCGPGDIPQAHSPNEFVELGQIARCEDLLDRLIQTPRRRDHGRSTRMSITTSLTDGRHRRTRARVRRAVALSRSATRSVVRRHRLRLVRGRHRKLFFPTQQGVTACC